jgi:hypothetical protein
VLNFSDKVTVWDWLKSSMWLVEVGRHDGKNESGIAAQHWTPCILSTSGLFLNGGVLGVRHRRYCISCE